MRSTPLSCADEPDPSTNLVETPLQPFVFSDSDSEVDESDQILDAIGRSRSDSPMIINQVFGGRGGRGGGAGVHGVGGSGGPGEGPTLRYDIRTNRLTMKTYKTTETNLSSTHANPSTFPKLRANRVPEVAAGAYRLA
ncbi:hypothetical protein MSAN_01609100 [Mycena sanguinolenta]|uniref:Uncharacterized protein n=1 Tax=Mycena sanguinolenta TaxID=230812 RepID=A0A8H6Y1W8_9AGAR|nr:hypothetical protein MSAN_01609100 [Mycena sanguinolenta]